MFGYNIFNLMMLHNGRYLFVKDIVPDSIRANYQNIVVSNRVLRGYGSFWLVLVCADLEWTIESVLLLYASVYFSIT